MFDSPTQNNDTQSITLPENATFEEKSLNIEKEETQLLKILLEKQKKQLIYARISGIAVVVMALILLVTCLKIVPPIMSTLEQLDGVMQETNELVVQAQGTIAEVDVALDSLETMSGEITTAAEGINSLVDGNSEVLTEAMGRLNGIDFEGLNAAIADLQAVVEPMANFMNKFR